ncbi:MAG: lipid II flippase MurJ [Pseudolysinimonas sp.]
MRGHAAASAVIAGGTIASRATGVLRSIMLVSVIGSYGSRAADAFTTANMLPTSIYEIIAAGVITGIVVPQIVRASTHSDGGNRFISKLLTLGAVVLVASTLLAIIAAPLLIALYAPFYTPEQQGLALSFAYWCLPQLLFYGLYALIGEVLNARRVFGPYSWVPTANNIVSIIGFAVFLFVYGGPTTHVAAWDGTMVAVLGATATLGIVIQAGLLAFFWRRTSIRFRPDFAWRGMGLRQLSRLALWTLLTVVVSQVAGLVQSIVLSNASGAAGYTVLVYAWLVFMLPHSVVTLSVSTAYYTRLAELAAEKRLAMVGDNLQQSIRVVSLFAFGFMMAIAAASGPVAHVFTQNRVGALTLAMVLCAFLVGLVPSGVLVILRRAFFAFNDTRRAFYFALVQAILVIVGSAIAFVAASLGYVAVAQLAFLVALSQSLATFAQLPFALRLLRRHLPELRLTETWRALARFALASVVGLVGGIGTFLLLGGVDGWTMTGRVQGAVGGGIIALVALGCYLGALALFRAPEIGLMLAMVNRVRRRADRRG